ncbi:hypothetical protein [Paraburkholderia sediminicola]|uniref:hypothetical protein n=1 Tax=Paraburkholderia sediminicola TaxID=458836 RepID=UPI0038BAA31E
MMTPANFQVVDGKGHVHAKNLTSSQANGMAEMLLATRTLGSVRTEPMNAAPQPAAPACVPHIVPTAEPLPAIKPGSERDALREAIDAHLDTSARLDSANQAVERARAFLDARQVELDALQAVHEDEVKASGATLAAILKAGGNAVLSGDRVSRGAVLEAEASRDTASAALDQLIAEQVESDSTYKAAETAVRLAVMAVKRADVAAMVERLEAVKAEFTALATAIDAARFADVPMTIRAQDAIRLDVPGTGSISETAARWHRYSAALRDDVDATWEDMQ